MAITARIIPVIATAAPVKMQRYHIIACRPDCSAGGGFGPPAIMTNARKPPTPNNASAAPPKIIRLVTNAFFFMESQTLPTDLPD